MTDLVKNPLLLFNRNAPCICGSGKKFKLCHRPKLPRVVPREMAVDNFKFLEKYREQKAKK